MKGIDGSILGKFLGANVKLLLGFFDNAYKQGWLIYLIVGLIGLVFVVVFFN